MLKRFLKGLIGIILLPVCAAESIAFIHILKVLPNIGWPQAFFLGGIALYAVCFFLSFRLNLLYVFAHEAVHAIITLLCGGEVKSFHVSSRGGSVSTTKSNFIISLGPYFVPLYTILTGLAFFLLRFSVTDVYKYTNIYMFILGFTICFHFFMTVNTLRVEQPDLTSNGYIFSLTLIFLVNIFVLAALLSVTFKEINLADFASVFFIQTKYIALFCWDRIAAFASVFSAGS